MIEEATSHRLLYHRAEGKAIRKESGVCRRFQSRRGLLFGFYALLRSATQGVVGLVTDESWYN